MTQIEHLLEKKTPFAVMQYFESLKTLKEESFKKYELIYLNKKLHLAFKVLSEKEVSSFKENTDFIKLVIDNKHGRVYEFNGFKKYKEANIKAKKP